MRPPPALQLTVSPRRVLTTMLLIIGCLLLGHLITQLLDYVANFDFQFGLLRWFDLHEETNLPTWYAATNLLICAGLLAFIAWSHRRLGTARATAWAGLSLIFCYLSLDEATMIHETMLEPLVLRVASGARWEGYWSYPWVIAGIGLVLLVSALYLRFLFELPRRTRVLFLIAGALYVGGALGVEIITARYDAVYGMATLGYSLWVMLEEAAELSGVAL